MAKLTARQFREKHARNTIAAREDMIRGIGNVREAPGELAAEKAEKMLAGITEAVNSGRWGERVRSVGLEEWKRLMLEKGVPRVNAGITAAASDIEDFAQQLLDHQDSYLPAIHDMADLTLEDNIQRAAENMRQGAKFRRR